MDAPARNCLLYHNHARRLAGQRVRNPHPLSRERVRLVVERDSRPWGEADLEWIATNYERCIGRWETFDEFATSLNLDRKSPKSGDSLPERVLKASIKPLWKSSPWRAI